jgi:SRSO17 transposase
MEEWTMELTEEFERYLDHVSEGLGRSERKSGLRNYCQGLMLPLQRKSMEPLAAALDPEHVCARHPSLQQFVADSPWSDEDVLSRVQSWVLPKLGATQRRWVFLIADDTGMPKAGRHSVGVARQYGGQLGKTANCQVAASLPIQYRLYLPPEWTADRERCEAAGVPADVAPLTKPQTRFRSSRPPGPQTFPAMSSWAMRATATLPTIVTALPSWGCSMCWASSRGRRSGRRARSRCPPSRGRGMARSPPVCAAMRRISPSR